MNVPLRSRWSGDVVLTTLTLVVGGHATGVSQTPAQAFTGVTVIDVTDGRLMPAQTVVVVGNRVQTVGPVDKVSVPVGAHVVDARGKYLIPGLWDMHVHLGPTNADNPLYRRFIAHGVTGLRDMAQRYHDGAATFRQIQHEFATGAQVGPRLIGPSVDLTSGGYGRIHTVADAPRIMDSLKAAGTAFVKYHDTYGDRDLFFAIAREARRVGLPLVGHIPETVTNIEIADSGMQSVEHAYSNHQCWPPADSAAEGTWPWWGKPIGDLEAVKRRCAPVVAAYIRNGTWVTPTMAVKFYKDLKSANLPAAERPSGSSLEDYRKLVRALHHLNFRRFLTGTDMPSNGTEPGFTLPQELIFLVEAGLTPLEALQAGTINPATFLKATDSLGTIAPNKLADLVLLDANPLVDIYNVMAIRAVVVNGRYLDRTTLDAFDAAGIEQIKTFAKHRPQSVKATNKD